MNANVGKLRWLLTEAAHNVGLVLTVNMINKVCDAQDQIMRDNGMVLMWQSQVDDTVTEMEMRP
jgi:fibronectin type 3 domain-containing protein